MLYLKKYGRGEREGDSGRKRDYTKQENSWEIRVDHWWILEMKRNEMPKIVIEIIVVEWKNNYEKMQKSKKMRGMKPNVNEYKEYKKMEENREIHAEVSSLRHIPSSQNY